VVLDSSNALYITDEQNQRVQKWLTNASTGTTVAGSSNATTGSTLDYLNYPSVLLIDSSGNLYVADAGNHRVAYWPNGASSGTLVAGNGRKSS
jgi:sugar lactone lactonase YvrE